MWLIVVAALLVLLSLIGDAYTLSRGQVGLVAERIVRLVDLDQEANAPAFYSTALLLAASGLLALIARHHQVRSERSARHWWALAVVFLGLAFDEAAEIHETMIGPFQRLFEGNRLLHFGWVVPGTAFVVAVGAFFMRFLFGLEPRTRNLFIAAGFVFVGGALGIEFIEGYIASGRGEDNWPYVIALSVQEWMEMMGAILFIYALLDYLRRVTEGMDLSWGPRG